MHMCKMLSWVPAASMLYPLMCAARAPPGVMQWQTLGSPFMRDCAGRYLSTIGWRGQEGVKCANLQWDDPTLYTLNYLLGDECKITLFAEEGCFNDQVVMKFEESTDEHNRCVEVPTGFRSLSVTCGENIMYFQ